MLPIGMIKLLVRLAVFCSELFSEVPRLRLAEKFLPLFLNLWLYKIVPLMLGEVEWVLFLL